MNTPEPPTPTPRGRRGEQQPARPGSHSPKRAASAGGLEVHFDGGYSRAHRLAAWAVVVTDGVSTELVARGHVQGSGAQDGEREALTRALEVARARGIALVRGDNIDPRVNIPEGVTVEHISTRDNQADAFTKSYPAWFEHKAAMRN